MELAQGIPKLFRVALVCNHKDLVPCHTGQLVLQPDRQYVPSRFIRHRGLADAEPGVGTLHMNGEPLIRFLHNCRMYIDFRILIQFGREKRRTAQNERVQVISYVEQAAVRNR